MNTDFISVYDNALTHEECLSVIDYMESSEMLPSFLAGRYQPDKKDSVQVPKQSFHDNNTVVDILGEALWDKTNLYVKEHPQLAERVASWSPVPDYNLQKYNPGQGYHLLHCENGGGRFSLRMLVWMIYLNTVTDGGGTYFENYDKTLDAVEGRCVIWPAYWTHCHKGIVSNTQTKYIATGWFEFKE